MKVFIGYSLVFLLGLSHSHTLKSTHISLWSLYYCKCVCLYLCVSTNDSASPQPKGQPLPLSSYNANKYNWEYACIFLNTFSNFNCAIFIKLCYGRQTQHWLPSGEDTRWILEPKGFKLRKTVKLYKWLNTAPGSLNRKYKTVDALLLSSLFKCQVRSWYGAHSMR